MSTLENTLKQLRLSGLLQTLDVRLQEAVANRLGHAEFLELICQDEVNVRRQRMMERRTKAADFRGLKTLEDFDWSFNPAIHRKDIYDLATGNFIRQAKDVLFLGPPGVGKTHLAQAVGYEAIKMNFQVLYRSIFDLVRDFMKDEAFRQQDRTLRRYLNPELLIIDDFGLKHLPKNSGEHLFEVIMRRYENRSSIMTSNRPLEELPLPGGTTGSKTTPPSPERRIKTRRADPSPTNLRPQNRRAEWLAFRFCSFHYAAESNMRIRFNCLRIGCLSTILCMAYALVPIRVPAQTADRFWWNGKFNGQPARLALDTGCDFGIVLWRGTAERLGLKLKDSGKQICPWVSDPFKIELPLYERRWGFPVAMVDRIRAPVCEAPSLANEDGLVGWPVISRRITRFDAVHSRFEFLRNVPREVQNWAKFTIRTNEHVLVLEGFNSDGAGGGLFIDTGDADGSVGLSEDLWDQWVAAHPQGRRGIWADLGVEGLTPRERTWTSQFPIGNLPLTNAVLDRVENAWFSKKLVVEIGFVVLKQFDLVVDGQHSVAYLKRSKECKNSMVEPPDQTFLDGGGVVFGPWWNQTNSLIAHVMVGANPAFQTSIRDGDVLLKVDQKDVMQWLGSPGKNWLSAFRAYGIQNVKASTNSPTGTKVELTLRRRDQVFQASVLQSEMTVIAPRKTK